MRLAACPVSDIPQPVGQGSLCARPSLVLLIRCGASHCLNRGGIGTHRSPQDRTVDSPGQAHGERGADNEFEVAR